MGGPLWDLGGCTSPVADWRGMQQTVQRGQSTKGLFRMTADRFSLPGGTRESGEAEKHRTGQAMRGEAGMTRGRG